MFQNFPKIWIIVILIVFIAGGILVWRALRGEEGGTLKEEGKVYQLVAAYPKENIYIKNLETGQEVKVTNIDKILIFKQVLSCLAYEDEYSFLACLFAPSSETGYQYTELNISDSRFLKILELQTKYPNLLLAYGGIEDKPIWSSDGKKIFFGKNVEMNTTMIYSNTLVLDIVNKKQISIVNYTNLADYTPSNSVFSQDSTKLAFVIGPRIFIADLDLLEKTNKSKEVFVGDVARGYIANSEIPQIQWFSDNERLIILYSKTFGDEDDLFALNTKTFLSVLNTKTGSSEELITLDDIWTSTFDLSPDESKLAYFINRDNKNGTRSLEINISNLKDRSIRKIYSSLTPSYYSNMPVLKWSPDSSMLAFSIPMYFPEDKEGEIIIMDETGKILETFNNTDFGYDFKFAANSLSWSPDNKNLAINLLSMSSGEDPKHEIWLLNISTKERKLMAPGDISIIWMPTELVDKIMNTYTE